nr:putative ribonuclease h protein [Quercus suber]
MEFYESNDLKKIGRAISPVLRIDSHTANGEWGRFARLCVQVNLDKPLVRKIYLGKLSQCVLYEGINALCFSCGRIEHKLEACRYTVREQPKEQNMDRSEGHTERQSTQGEDGLKEKVKSQEDYELVPVNGEKQKTGLSADEGRSMDHDSEPVVEVFDGQTFNSGASNDKLKAISHRIRHAELEKISVRGGSGVDEANDHYKKLLQTKPVESLLMGNLHKVEMIQFAEPEMNGTILIKATQEEMGIIKHSVSLFRGIWESRKELLEAWRLNAKLPKVKAVITVGWEKPPMGWAKLNSDGSTFSNLGRAGGGGVIRDHDGRWLKGYARPIGCTNSCMAEL